MAFRKFKTCLDLDIAISLSLIKVLMHAKEATSIIKECGKIKYRITTPAKSKAKIRDKGLSENPVQWKFAIT